MHKPLIIIGDSAFAEIAAVYFDTYSDYQVVAFSVERDHLKKEELLGKPIVAFESVEEKFSPKDHSVFVAITYTQLNRLRTRLLEAAKAKGYRPASFVSPNAFVGPEASLGEHCFVFEDNTIQPFVKVGSNVVLWSGNHIGHHSTIGDNCFISSHVVISGFCKIGDNSFLGVNSSVANNVDIGPDNWVGPGVSIFRSTAPEAMFSGTAVEPSRVTTKRFFRLASTKDLTEKTQ